MKRMIRGNGSWSYDEDAEAWYFRLEERGKPPYLKQVRTEALVDIDSEGKVAGIEIISLDGKYTPPLTKKD